jgi:hypothetical protein
MVLAERLVLRCRWAVRIRERSRLIMYAIDARKQRFPKEEPYRYKPLAAQEEFYRWNPGVRASLKDYNLLDLGI